MTNNGWDLDAAQQKRLEKLFKQAARSSMLMWRNGKEDGYQDLAQDLWVKVLESPGTQLVLLSLNDNELVATLKNMAVQVLSDEQHKLDLFRQSVLYSSDNVKDALKGQSTNWSLIALLPDGLQVLARRNEGHAASIENRYLKHTVPPRGSADEARLKRAVKSLTEIVNALCISNTKRDGGDKLTVKDGPGSAAGKFPQDKSNQGMGEAAVSASSRRSGGHSDPTANQALAILRRPEIEKDLLHQDPITELTRPPRHVVTLPDGRGYRLSSVEQALLDDNPDKLPEVIERVLERVC